MKKLSMLMMIIILSSCGNDDILIPKPPTYLRLDLPDHTYTEYKSQCGYRFESSSLFKVKDVADSAGK
jgi:hypothetical protein